MRRLENNRLKTGSNEKSVVYLGFLHQWNWQPRQVCGFLRILTPIKLTSTI